MRRYWIYCFVAFICDFVTKGVFFHYLPQAEITPFLNIVSVWNPGITFGLLQSNEMLGRYLLTGFICVIIGYLIYWLKTEENPKIKTALSIILGGALGNLLDRLRFGAVYDFIDVYIGVYHWPAFNVADSCITLGTIYLIYISLRDGEQLGKVRGNSKK